MAIRYKVEKKYTHWQVLKEMAATFLICFVMNILIFKQCTFFAAAYVVLALMSKIHTTFNYNTLIHSVFCVLQCWH